MASKSRPRGLQGQERIIADLERLSHEDGFIYTFCILVFKSLCAPVDELADINWHERLNHQRTVLPVGSYGKAPTNNNRTSLRGNS